MKKPTYGRLNKGKSCFPVLSSTSIFIPYPPPSTLIYFPSTHVHLNQPGRTAWEGFRTGTLAAISGGITTLIDMPLNSIPPTTTLSGLATKKACAKEVGVSCDLGFWGGLVPGNEGELRGLWEAGVKGFKCFLIESGVDVSFPL